MANAFKLSSIINKRAHNETGFGSLKSYKLRHTFTVENVWSMICVSNKYVCLPSEVFRIPDDGNISWKLGFAPNIYHNSRLGRYFAVNLEVISTNIEKKFNLKGVCKLQFETDESTIFESDDIIFDFATTTQGTSKKKSIYHQVQKIAVKRIKKGSPLIIICDIQYYIESKDIGWYGAINNNPSKCNESSSKTNFKNYFDMCKAKIPKDYSLISNGQSYPIHKFLLVGLSSVFRKALKVRKFRYLRKNSIEIIKCRHSAILKLVEYLNTGDIKDTTDLDDFRRLLYLERKYKIIGLRYVCEKKLINSISLNNLIEILEIGYDFKSDDIMNACSLTV